MSNYTMNHQPNNNINDVEEEDVHIDVHEIFNLFDEMFDGLNAYEIMEVMDDEDWSDLSAIRLMFARNKRLRKLKFMHERTDWDGHVAMLIYTNKFENRFRMTPEHFEYLLNAIRDAITVDFARSSNSTGGNEPIYPEMILAMGLRFCGLGSTVPDLADVYGISDPSVRRCITMFLDAIDYNTTCAELQVKLPDPNDSRAHLKSWHNDGQMYHKLLGYSNTTLDVLMDGYPALKCHAMYTTKQITSVVTTNASD